MKKFSAETAVIVSPDKVCDSTLVRSFIQNWLAPALAKKLAEEKTEKVPELFQIVPCTWVLHP